jgi:S1-C subfamily serine protease
MPVVRDTLLAFMLVALALGLSDAHADVNYVYNNQKYTSAAAFLADFRRDLDYRLTAVVVSPKPLPGKALIVVPDRDRLRPLIMSTATAATKADPETPITARYAFIRAQASAIARARIFEKTEIAEQNETIAPAMEGYDYLIWFQVKSVRPDFVGPWTAQWLMRKAGATTVSDPLAVDPGIPPARQLAAFADVVRDAAPRLGGGAQVAAGAGGASTALHRADSGTGIIVARDGLIVTNDHVVRNCGDIRVHDRDGAATAATLKAHDEHNDLALLKSSHEWPAAARFRDGAAIRAGDGVVAIGYPLTEMIGSESEASITTGAVSALSGMGNDTRFLQLTAPVQPGNSGGALLDMSGRLVGVVTAKLNAIAVAGVTGDIPQNVNFALKEAVVRSFLDANSVAYSEEPAATALSAADVGDTAKKFTVLVECRK